MVKSAANQKKNHHPPKPPKKDTHKGGKKGNGAVAAKPAAKAAPKPPAKAAKPRPELTAKITHLIAEEMAVEEAELTPSAAFKEDLGLDEIDVAELLMQSETSFDLSPFNDEDWESCETVGDLTSLIEKRVAAKRSKK
jgi:acyl carrier protein